MQGSLSAGVQGSLSVGVQGSLSAGVHTSLAFIAKILYYTVLCSVYSSLPNLCCIFEALLAWYGQQRRSVTPPPPYSSCTKPPSYSTCLSVHQVGSHVQLIYLPLSTPGGSHVQLLYLPLSTPGEESCTVTLPASQYTRRGVMYIVQML